MQYRKIMKYKVETLVNTAFTHEIASGERQMYLQEFREHLGGELTIQMLRKVGEGFNVHEVDEDLMREAIARLR